MFYYIVILIYQFQHSTNFPLFLAMSFQQQQVIHPLLKTAILPDLAWFLETNENLKLLDLVEDGGCRKTSHLKDAKRFVMSEATCRRVLSFIGTILRDNFLYILSLIAFITFIRVSKYVSAVIVRPLGWYSVRRTPFRLKNDTEHFTGRGLLLKLPERIFFSGFPNLRSFFTLQCPIMEPTFVSCYNLV